MNAMIVLVIVGSTAGHRVRCVKEGLADGQEPPGAIRTGWIEDESVPLYPSPCRGPRSFTLRSQQRGRYREHPMEQRPEVVGQRTPGPLRFHCGN